MDWRNVNLLEKELRNAKLSLDVYCGLARHFEKNKSRKESYLELRYHGVDNSGEIHTNVLKAKASHAEFLYALSIVRCGLWLEEWTRMMETENLADLPTAAFLSEQIEDILAEPLNQVIPENKALIREYKKQITSGLERLSFLTTEEDAERLNACHAYVIRLAAQH